MIIGTAPIGVISEHPKHHRVITDTAPICVDRDRTDRDRDLADFDRADLDRDRDRDLAFVCPDLMIFFWVLFVL